MCVLEICFISIKLIEFPFGISWHACLIFQCSPINFLHIYHIRVYRRTFERHAEPGSKLDYNILSILYLIDTNRK